MGPRSYLRAGQHMNAYDGSLGLGGNVRTASWLGTSDPGPRTWRSIGPRFTVSVQTVARSTVGAAGFSRKMPIEIAARTKATAATIIVWRRRF